MVDSDLARFRLLSSDVLREQLADDGGSDALRSASRVLLEGDVEVGLLAGDRTTWVVGERIRKLYLS